MSAQNSNPEKISFSATELLDLNIEEVPKLWEPFFPSKGLVGIIGSSDCGKSSFCRQLALAICQNQKEFLGFPLHGKRGSAIIVCTEDEVEGIAALLRRQMGTDSDTALNHLHFIFRSEELTNVLEQEMNATKPDIVIIDVWADTYTGNPNNWVDVRANLHLFKTLAQRHDCLICLIHHNVKNSEKGIADKNKLNGSQAIEAKMRCLLAIRNASVLNERHLFVLKNNYMSREAKDEGIVLQVDGETLAFSNSGKKISVMESGESEGTGYNSEVWVQRMTQIRATTDISFDKARQAFVSEYGEQDTPSASWFKTKLKGK